MHNMISLWHLNTRKETKNASAQAAIEDLLNHGWDPQFGVSLISTQLLKLLSWSLENVVSDLYDFLLFFSKNYVTEVWDCIQLVAVWYIHKHGRKPNQNPVPRTTFTFYYGKLFPFCSLFQWKNNYKLWSLFMIKFSIP